MNTDESFDLLLKNGHAVTPAGVVRADIAVRGGKIAGIGAFDGAREVIDCAGLHILPGIIDSHVHFREPGLTHKEDLSTGTAAALMGGVTTVFEMPNTEPLTLSADTLNDKLARAAAKSFCDYAFYIGACAQNAHLLGALEMLPGCAGVKIFMGSSTGALLAAQDEVIENILRHGRRRVALHAEDEDRLTARRHIAQDSGDVADHPVWRDAACALRAVERAVAIARKTRRRVHFLHVTSAEEMAYLRGHKDIATVETTPQHLTLCAEDAYARLGTRAQMNPPIRGSAHRDALWRAVSDGTVDTLGSDHAPHTLEEKARPYPQSPSGMPGVQTMLPVMLDHVHHGRLTLARLVDLLCHGPARVYGITGKGRIAAGMDADFALVDLAAAQTLSDRHMLSKCGWTPYDGMRVTGRVQGTVLRGRVVQWDGQLVGESPRGRPVSFDGANFAPAPSFDNLTESNIQGLHIDCC